MVEFKFVFKSFYRIEGNKIILEQRDRKTKELQVLATKYVNNEGKLFEVRKFFIIIFVNKT